MRILLDECVPRKLKFMLIAAGYDCETARDAGFGGMTNGKLLAQAESLFDVLVTIDRNIQLSTKSGQPKYRDSSTVCLLQ